MTSDTPDLLRYLENRGFRPSPQVPAWLDLATPERQTLRVLREPDASTFLYCLDQDGTCLYEAVFSPGTPYEVTTAVIDAALGPARPVLRHVHRFPAARPRKKGDAR